MPRLGIMPEGHTQYQNDNNQDYFRFIVYITNDVITLLKENIKVPMQ